MTKARDLADFVSAGNPLADGTIDVADINGITATTAELNYTDGVTSNIQTQLDAKVDLAGDTMTGALILSADPTVALGAATKQYADAVGTTAQSYADTAVSNLVDTAPATLDTLNELAAALGDDPNFATTVTNSIATKLPLSGGTMTGDITFNSTQLFDGRDVSADGAKLDGIEAGADVTDAANVTAAGALMDSELTNITAVKALNQGVATTDSPTFAGGTFTGNVSFGDNDKAIFGAGSDLQVYHDGGNSYLTNATGSGILYISGDDVVIRNTAGTETKAQFVTDGAVTLYYDNAAKLATTSYGVSVTGSAVASTITASISGSTDLNFDTYQNFVLTVTSNATLNNPTTEKVGQSGFIVFIHSGAGRTISLGSDFETAGGAGLTLSGTSGATDIVPYIVAASGRILLGTPQLAFS